MASESVLKPNEIHLDGKLYRTVSLTEKLSSVYPEKQVFGDYTRESDPTKSQIVFSDWRGGLGQAQIDTQAEANRTWDSDCQLRYKGHLIQAFLNTITNDLDPANAAAIGIIINSAIRGSDEIYVAFGTDLRTYADGGAWTNRATLPAAATDALEIELDGTTYLVIATTGGYSYSSNGTAWTDDTKDAKYLASWNDQLWGIDNTGQLWRATAIGTETDDAKLPLAAGSVTDLFVYDDANGESILYVTTTTGLWAHDFANARFFPTRLQWPQAANAGRGSVVWRDGVLYIPTGGLQVFGYDPRTTPAQVLVMGPDRDDGLIAAKRGDIIRLASSHNDLLALINSNGATIQSSILGWNGQAWEQKWTSSANVNVDYIHVCSAYSSYRIWFSTNKRISHQAIPTELINPDTIGTGYSYAAVSRHYTPWFTAGRANVDKIALMTKMEVSGLGAGTTNPYLNLAYAIDFVESYTDIVLTLRTNTSGGRPTEYNFPATGDAVGVAFRAIRFRVEEYRGSTTTKTVDLRSLILEYATKLRVKREWVVTLDLNQAYDGQAPGEQRSSLNTALAAQTLVRFTFRDDADNSRRYNVLVFQEPQPVLSGHDERGLMTLHLVEP